MILHPPVIALVAGSLLTSAMLLYATFYGVQILRHWDIDSGSELQLNLERRTYLISTLVSYAFAFQLLSFFLFIFTADDLRLLFTGAMCAVGSLFVNAYGYPTLILKLANFLLAGLWLVLNHADNMGRDYPLIRRKYLLLLCITPVILAETIVQALYFLGLNPNVITSCCGSLFSVTAPGIGSELASLPRIPAEIAFAVVMATTLVSGGFYYLKGKGGILFSAASAVLFVVSIVALISFICPYLYEIPTHHCPFCILQKEYRYVGYILYGTMLVGSVTGMGVGVVAPFTQIPSLSSVLPLYQRRLTITSLILYGIFAITVAVGIYSSELRWSDLK